MSGAITKLNSFCFKKKGGLLMNNTGSQKKDLNIEITYCLE